MMEGAVMEYAKIFIGFISTFLIATVALLMFNLNEMNSFQQEVNYQIERHGGLTPEAMDALNLHAVRAYGGCLAESSEFGAGCLEFNDPAIKAKADAMNPDGKSSGFFVREYKVKADGTMQYYDRTSDKQARYGTQIRYVTLRHIGKSDVSSMFTPAVVGSSASRVRGTSAE